MAAIWKGSITFGLVSIPVELRSAVRSDNISFRMLHEEDLSPIKYDRVCAREEKSVPYDEIVKGYEYSKGKFVVMDDEDFKAATVESSKTIEIQDFVKSEEIDPRYFESPYYLLPQKGGDKAYALLREAIRNTGMVGIGMVTMPRMIWVNARRTPAVAAFSASSRTATRGGRTDGRDVLHCGPRGGPGHSTRRASGRALARSRCFIRMARSERGPPVRHTA